MIEFPDCHPANPECEYSEESLSPDPAARTHRICLTHFDQIEAAKFEQAEQERAMRPHLDESVWGPTAPIPASHYDESPF